MLMMCDSMSFSPLRFWGHLYRLNMAFNQFRIVLVPFVFGVIYIQLETLYLVFHSFSPLRFWGHLYRRMAIFRWNRQVLVPFVFGVIYITKSKMIRILYKF